VPVVRLIVAGILVWTGAMLLLGSWWRRERRPELAERLRPFQPGSLADEAHDWLHNRQPLD
jgi:hypothetical protein